MPKVHKPNTMLFREAVGTATSDDGEEIELTTGVSSRAPIIQIEGRYVSFTWEELITQAQEALDKQKESNADTSDS